MHFEVIALIPGYSSRLQPIIGSLNRTSCSCQAVSISVFIHSAAIQVEVLPYISLKNKPNYNIARPTESHWAALIMRFR